MGSGSNSAAKVASETGRGGGWFERDVSAPGSYIFRSGAAVLSCSGTFCAKLVTSADLKFRGATAHTNTSWGRTSTARESVKASSACFDIV